MYWYNSRWYDPYLARFNQPDTIIPDQYDPNSWDRYLYVAANPLRFTDPTGHYLDDGSEEGGYSSAKRLPCCNQPPTPTPMPTSNLSDILQTPVPTPGPFIGPGPTAIPEQTIEGFDGTIKVISLPSLDFQGMTTKEQIETVITVVGFAGEFAIFSQT